MKTRNFFLRRRSFTLWLPMCASVILFQNCGPGFQSANVERTITDLGSKNGTIVTPTPVPKATPSPSPTPHPAGSPTPTPTATPMPTATPTPTPTPTPGHNVSLTWQSPLGGQQDGFLVEESTDGMHFTQISSLPATATSTQVNSLGSGTYYFRIKSFNSVGQSSYGAVQHITIP